ncbi:MAG: hypothetical protein M3004_13470 [Bacteroidota bacterium]|nr:hypothetical protein [Bacteroidota bacterium]
MSIHSPLTVIGFHSCDREVGLKVLNGQDDLLASQNSWDWLGEGIYFWEQDPVRALSYATESSQNKQFNKVPIKTPFVLGAIIQLGNCLNLVESESLKILAEAYEGLKILMEEAGQKLPANKGNNRALDCQVIQYINQTNKEQGLKLYDTIRCAFPEGGEAYPGAAITSRLHIQICVLNKECIGGYFLPMPHEKFNPNLRK